MDDGEPDEEEAMANHQCADAGIHGEADVLDSGDPMSDDDAVPNASGGWLYLQNSESEPEDDMPQEVHDKNKITRRRVCEEQSEYQDLHNLGLTERPAGCSIGIHPASKVWRACAAGSQHHGRCFGPSSGRTARQALLRVIELMLVDHMQQCPTDRLAKRQLERVRSAREAEGPHKD